MVVERAVNRPLLPQLMETYQEIASNTSRAGSRTWNAATLITLHSTVRRVKNWNSPRLSRVGLKPERLRMSKQEFRYHCSACETGANCNLLGKILYRAFLGTPLLLQHHGPSKHHKESHQREANALVELYQMVHTSRAFWAAPVPP